MKTYPCFSRLKARVFVLASALAVLAVCGRAANPAIMEPLTADPAAIVNNGMVYLYTGHDEAEEKHHVMAGYA